MEDKGIAPNNRYTGTADLVGMGRKSRNCTLFQYSVPARLAAQPTADQL
jgi:hypothetical protein